MRLSRDLVSDTCIQRMTTVHKHLMNIYWIISTDGSNIFLHVQQVALKTLIVVHRLLREGDPTFREELLNFSQRGRILQLSNFKDDSSPIGWF